MAVYGGIPQARVSPYEPYTPGTDFGAWRQKNPFRAIGGPAMPGTRAGVPGVGGPMPMFYSKRPEPTRPQIPTPTETPFEPRVPTPIEPPFEQQTATPIEPPFERQTPTPIETPPPFEPQTPTPIETEESWTEPRSWAHARQNWILYKNMHGPNAPPPRSVALMPPLESGIIHFPSWGFMSLKSKKFERALKKELRPGITGIEYLIQRFGDDVAWQIIEIGSLNPADWIKHFEQPQPQTPFEPKTPTPITPPFEQQTATPIEPRVEPTPRRF